MALASPASRFVVVNGLRLHYLDFGGEGPPAVLHHATGFHAWVWAPIAEALTQRYRVFALDARGHGDSDKPDAYEWKHFVADLVGFVEALRLGRVLGVGHSLGATTTAGAAAEHPDVFSAAVLLDPVVYPREFRWLTEDENPMSAIARRRRDVWDDYEQVFESYRGRGAFAKWRDDLLRLYVHQGFAAFDGGVRLKCPPSIEAQVFSMDMGVDGWEMMSRVHVPTLLVRGAQSDTLSAAAAEELCRSLPHGQLRTLPDTTHTFPMEAPDEVAQMILEFTQSELPMPTRGLAHLALNVERLEESVRFYRDVLGMWIVWQPDADNVYLSSGRDNLALHRARQPRTANGSPLDHLGFLVESPERVFAAGEALARRGVPLLRPPKQHRDGSCSLYLQDPDGNAVQILYEPNASRR
jgi:pimeloyl-ACP methyl ester carboxylesterase/catechol 2,3-dioxygenase-like lactoylglutathione lyase family enzyme